MHNIPQNVIKNLEFLKKLSKTKSQRKREIIFKEATNDQIALLIEICYNILKGYFLLTKKQKHRLIPYVNFIRKLGRVRTEKGAKKIIQQSGGGFISFAPLLLPIIIAALKYGK